MLLAMTKINLDSKSDGFQGAVSCELGDEAAVLNTHTGIYYGLNPVAARIWSVLQERKLPVRELLGMLLAEFDVEPQRSEEDLVALLRQLATDGLIEIE
jgi:hypothetical protein